jgi:hypothetical protein
MHDAACTRQEHRPEEDIVRTQITLDALAVIGAATVTAAAVGLTVVAALDAGRWLLARTRA